MPKLIIDGQVVEVEAGTTVLQACEKVGVEIPRFCYHERLAIAGNCRMCLVEMEKSPKPIASCAMPVADNMVIHTDTPLVKKAREGVMEFLLINHPLDCPICDQGGECDLQDQAMAYGRGSNRFHENKRAVKDKNIGPLIKTHMNRCIHCTRCIRFSTEVAGVPELGATGRGEHMEVGTYVEKAISSELSGNLIDICPVGALTSKPYAFKARSWELTKTESIDVLDAVGSNIRIDARGLEVMRILPRLHEDINEEWISDKTRFSYDGLKLQRLDRPMIRKEGKLVESSWEEAYQLVADKLKNTNVGRIAAIVGDLADCESIYVLKNILDKLEVDNRDCRQDMAKLNSNTRSSYLFNTTIAGIEQSDLCLLVGANPRYEASLVNARLRKRYLRNGFTVANIGVAADLTYPVEQLGDNPNILKAILEGNHPFAEKLKQAKFPMIIIGSGALSRKDGEGIISIINKIAAKYNIVRSDWNGFNILHKAASRVGALDLNFLPKANGMNTEQIVTAAAKGKIEVVYLLGVDEIDLNHLGNSFVIYQGHHGDNGAHTADVIFPGAAYTEKDATYVNLEGRVQRTKMAVSPPGQAKADWLILKKLADNLGIELPYDNLSTLRKAMVQQVPHLGSLDTINKGEWKAFSSDMEISSEPLKAIIDNFYMTDPISRASRIMAECTALIWNEKKAA